MHELRELLHGPGGDAGLRRRRLLELARAKAIVAPADRLAAAELLLDGDDLAEVDAAQSLALAAMAQEPAARRVAATALDRLRRLAGKPQKYGTQWVTKDGLAELWPVDAHTTDSERAKWGLPPLAELRRGGPC